MDQRELEYTYSKRHLMDVLGDDIQINWVSEIVYAIETYRSKTYSYDSKNTRISKLPDSLDLAISIILNVLRCNGEMTNIQRMATAISHEIDDDLLSAVMTAAEVLAVCEGGSVYELVAHNCTDNPFGTLAVDPKIKPSEETLIKIDQYMYVPPNIEIPQWLSNWCGGLSTIKDSVILGKGNTHNEYQALDALNILQRIEWELDEYMLMCPEEPNKPLDSYEKAKQFNGFKEASKRVYDMYKDRKFYFIWKFDKRGRMYSNGYHINLQSTDFKKSCLNFAHKEIISI